MSENDPIGLDTTRRVTPPGDVLARLAEAAPPENLDALCEYLDLDDEASETLKAGIKTALAKSSTAMTKLEQAALEKADKAILAAAGSAPKDVSKYAQFRNNLASGTVSWATGFGLAVGITKGVAAALGKSAIHFLDLAGPFMLLGSEVIAGKFRAQGPGYGAADLAAYTSHDVTCADQRRLAMKMAGMRAAGREDTKEFEALSAQSGKLTLARQSVCVGLIRRELGQALGLKANPAEADVPGDESCLRGCLRSKISVADDGAVSLHDGTVLFTATAALPGGGLEVTWPDGATTNLAKDQVPAGHMALFERMEADLVGAARLRSFIADELTISTFAAAESLGALGTWILQANGRTPATQAADALIGVTCAFVGTQVYLHSQNAARSFITGQGPARGVSRAEQLAKYAKAELVSGSRQARLKLIAHMRDQCHAKLIEARMDLAKWPAQAAQPQELLLESSSESVDSDSVETKRDELNALIRELEAVHSELKTMFRATRKEADVAQADMSKASGKLEGTRVGTMESWKALWQNKPLLACKLISYTVPFVIYTAAYAQYTYSLAPHPSEPAPDNFTLPGNLTDPGNMTFADQDMGVETMAQGLGSLTSYLVANAFNASVIAAPYLFKNNVLVRLGYNAYTTAAGGAEYLYERLRPAPAVTTAGDDSTTEPYADSEDSKVDSSEATEPYSGSGMGKVDSGD